MHTCKEYAASEQTAGVVIWRLGSLGDNLKANSLIDELKRQDVEVSAAGTESDVEGLLRLQCTGRCIVYLSPHSTADRDFCKSSVLSVASLRGRDAVVVVLDEALETPPDEWKDFLCLRYDTQRLSDLCRQLALLIQTPILSCRPQDITGYSAAFRVFSGYLRFVLVDFNKRLTTLPSDVYASCVQRLLFIFPDSCRCPPQIEKEGCIEHVDMYVLRTIKRAGQQYRDFNSSVYRIRDEERNRDCYFVAEFDNCLGSLSDIYKSGLAGMDTAHLHRVRDDYIHYLELLLEPYTGKYRILRWKDRDVNLDEFLLPVVREELESVGLSQEVSESPIITYFECTDGKGTNPGSIHDDPAKCYKLENDPKGICLIINIAKFRGCQKLSSRDGSEADVRQLVNVFWWLRFEIKEYRDVNKSEFLRIINEVRELDHTAYDAFVCCIMSHGYLGHIRTADGQSVPILEDIAHAFYPDNCPTLTGKPKIFFIQSCQIVTGSELVASEATTYEPDAEKCAAFESTKKSLLLPEAADFFMSYSTLPKSLSYRDPEKGTPYVQALAEVLKEGRELQAALCRVAQHVETNAPGQQRPFYFVSTDHKFVRLCGRQYKTVCVESITDQQRVSLPGADVDDTSPNQLEDGESTAIPQMPEKISGYNEAMNYFFGFLNLVLDDHRQKMKDVVGSGEKVVLPMLIVVPESCRAPKSFNVDGKIITSRDKYVVHPSHRGGRKNRDFRISVMELMIADAATDNRDVIVYFSGEFPAILMTLYETYKTGQAGLTADHLAEMCNDFYFTLQSLLCHPDNKHCVDQYRLLLWPDNRVNLHDFLLPFVLQYAEEGDASSLVCSPRDGGSYMLQGSSFKRLEPGVDLTTVWSGSQPYAMRPVSPRGICLIVVCDVTPNSAADVRLLRKMFCEQLDFDVRVHYNNQMTSHELDSLLCDVAQEDHSQYDAFVCRIASPGRLGNVCTSDGMCTSTNSLVDIFCDENSEQLRDKPKLFLVQTTDDGTTENFVFNNSESQSQTVTVAPSSSSSDQSLQQHRDSVSLPRDEGGETLVPSVRDVLISFVNVPASTAADASAGDSSLYVRALTHHLRPGVDVKDALDRVNQQCKDRLRQYFPDAKVVTTLNRPLVFPQRTKR